MQFKTFFFFPYNITEISCFSFDALFFDTLLAIFVYMKMYNEIIIAIHVNINFQYVEQHSSDVIKIHQTGFKYVYKDTVYC